MKITNLLMMSAVLGLGLASCSEDEQVSENRGQAIDFRAAMGTRATEITNANISSIKVASFMNGATFFEPLDFIKGTDGYFTSTPEYNWPGDNSELTFYAYAPSSMAGVTLTQDAKNIIGFSPAADIAEQVDFITSKATGTREVNEASGVELTFNHMLSQIEIRAKADNAAYTYKISGVRIGQPVSKGDFDFESSAWTQGTDKAVYESTYTNPVVLSATAQDVMGESGNPMLIPQQLSAWNPETDGANSAKGAYLSVKLQINTAAGAQVYPFASDSECDWAAIPVNTNWEPGKKYIYTLDFSHGAGYVDPDDPQPGKPVLGGMIKFTVNVVDWTDATQDLPMNTGGTK